jgi:hypothetical protein
VLLLFQRVGNAVVVFEELEMSRSIVCTKNSCDKLKRVVEACVPEWLSSSCVQVAGSESITVSSQSLPPQSDQHELAAKITASDPAKWVNCFGVLQAAGWRFHHHEADHHDW